MTNDKSDVDPLRRGQHAIVFIAHGFDEESVIRFYCEQRRLGRQVTLVSNMAGEIVGKHGFVLRAHMTISGYVTNMQRDVDAVCIPGNRQCERALLSDPRIFKLLQSKQIDIYTSHDEANCFYLTKRNVFSQDTSIS